MHFPQYRKYTNEKTFFKIISTTRWEELQIVGSKVILSQFEVKILPDRNFLNDMLNNVENSWIVIDADEYEQYRKSAIVNS